MKDRCTATTAGGEQCSNPATDGEVCWIHAPDSTARRPSSLDDLTERRILNAIEAGATYKLAAKAGGVTYETFRTWRNNREEFARKVEAAEWQAANGWLEAIDEAAKNGDWRAAAWRLERRYPGEYGKGRDREVARAVEETDINWDEALEQFDAIFGLDRPDEGEANNG